MQCPSCKSAVSSDLRFCLHCGRFLGEPEETTQVNAPRPQPASTIRAATPFVPAFETLEKPRRRRLFRTGVTLIAGILLLIAGGLIAAALIYNAGGITLDLPDNNRLTVLTPSPSREPKQRSESITTPEPVRPTPDANQQSKNLDRASAIPTPQVREVPIFNQTVGVGAGRFYSFQFTLAKTARLVGRFQAFGGSNDIAAAILDDDAFLAFSAGQATRAYYASAGYVTTDSVNLVLAPRTYYLTFDNRKAILTPKTVVAQFVIEDP
jgi:hypothetical protein